MNLAEKYRPRAWGDVLGQDAAVRCLQRLRDRGGLGGRAYLFSGKSGTGKTTLAYLVAGELAEPFNVSEINGRSMTIGDCEDLALSMRLRPLPTASGRRGRVWIVNEAHALRADVVSLLLDVLEPAGGIPAHLAVIFTTTVDGLTEFSDGHIDAEPLLSRFTRIALTTMGLTPHLAARAREIATVEGLNGKPPQAYTRLATRCHNNMRAMLAAVEAGAMLEGAEE